MKQQSILVIDSDSQSRLAAGTILESNRYDVSLSASGSEGTDFLSAKRFALVLLDVCTNDMAGLPVVQKLRSASADTRVIVQSTPADASGMETIFELGADDVIFKPYQAEELLFRVEKNIEFYELKQKVKVRKSLFSGCCICKKIRIDDYGPGNRWMEVEDFLKEELDILLSSTYCPKCAQTAQKDLLVQIDRLKALKVCR